MKKLLLLTLFHLFILTLAFGQDTEVTTEKEEKKVEKRHKKSSIIRQEEEGVLAYNKQTGFGLQLRTNGYGMFFELGRRKTPRFTNLYVAELTEIKNVKEEKSTDENGVFSNSYIYGKINNFYQFNLGFGQQYIFGQKGNKNGIAVLGIYNGGLSLGLLRPYYLDVNDGTKTKKIKYSDADSAIFLSPTNIVGGGGLTEGWDEIKIRPGAYFKAALRFDFGRFNESVQAIEIGSSVNAYANKIEIMAPVEEFGDAIEPKRVFYQVHIAFIFGRRK